MAKKRADRNPTAEIDPAEIVKQALAHADLQDVRAVHISCTQNLKAGQLPEAIEHSLVMAEGKYFKSRQTVAFTYHFQVTGLYPDSAVAAETPPPLMIQAAFQAAYRIEKSSKLGADDLVGALQPFGMINVWPYWRELVQSLTTRMGLPPLTMPLMKLPDAISEIQKGFDLPPTGDTPAPTRRTKKKASRKS